MTDVGKERLVISQLVHMHHKSGYISLTGVKWTGGSMSAGEYGSEIEMFQILKE